jgi:serine/threonine protein kinase
MHGLRHPGIVRPLNFDPYGDPPYLVTEYVPGTSLRELISRRALTIPDAVAVMKQVLAALAHAHAHGVVHRDVKPENVLVHERASRGGYAAEGVVRLTDFGLGQAANVSQGSILLSAEAGEGSRGAGGTHHYMPPEQASGATVDARADLYACGVVLFELLTGERPAGTELPSEINPSVPKHLDDAFRRAYARLERRFASAEEFAAALELPKAEPAAPASPVEPPPPATPVVAPPIAPGPSPRRGWLPWHIWASAGFAVGCILGLLIGLAASSRREEEVRLLTLSNPGLVCLYFGVAGAMVGGTLGLARGWVSAGLTVAFIAVPFAYDKAQQPDAPYYPTWTWVILGFCVGAACLHPAVRRWVESQREPSDPRKSIPIEYRLQPTRRPRRRRNQSAPDGTWPPPAQKG